MWEGTRAAKHLVWLSRLAIFALRNMIPISGRRFVLLFTWSIEYSACGTGDCSSNTQEIAFQADTFLRSYLRNVCFGCDSRSREERAIVSWFVLDHEPNEYGACSWLICRPQLFGCCYAWFGIEINLNAAYNIRIWTKVVIVVLVVGLLGLRNKHAWHEMAVDGAGWMAK